MRIMARQHPLLHDVTVLSFFVYQPVKCEIALARRSTLQYTNSSLLGTHLYVLARILLTLLEGDARAERG